MDTMILYVTLMTSLIIDLKRAAKLLNPKFRKDTLKHRGLNVGHL